MSTFSLDGKRTNSRMNSVSICLISTVCKISEDIDQSFQLCIKQKVSTFRNLQKSMTELHHKDTSAMSLHDSWDSVLSVLVSSKNGHMQCNGWKENKNESLSGWERMKKLWRDRGKDYLQTKCIQIYTYLI